MLRRYGWEPSEDNVGSSFCKVSMLQDLDVVVVTLVLVLEAVETGDAAK